VDKCGEGQHLQRTQVGLQQRLKILVCISNDRTKIFALLKEQVTNFRRKAHNEKYDLGLSRRLESAKFSQVISRDSWNPGELIHT
jgi:hypothetical protein